MTPSSPLHAFAGYGIELEYMIVDRASLSVVPIADKLLGAAGGGTGQQMEHGSLAWSNELVLHLIELKNTRPSAGFEPLVPAFQKEIRHLNHLLGAWDAKLMPAAAHPWMDPRVETRLWPHHDADIYAAYDRIFNCRQHGFANLQSMHVNLPFADDAEFARLHAAVRLALPILPALAASSPIVDGRRSGFLDFRMQAYRFHQARIPASLGQIVPDTVASRGDYERRVLKPMYRDADALDPEGVLRHEWFNARGAIPRFDRQAIEIRVIDVQECPWADLAIAAALIGVLKGLYTGASAPLDAQQRIATLPLAQIMHACIRDAEEAVIGNPEYLGLLGFPAGRAKAGELWQHLIATAFPEGPDEIWREPLQVILRQGPLARRILRTVGPSCTRSRLYAVYAELCRCLEDGRLFLGLE